MSRDLSADLIFSPSKTFVFKKIWQHLLKRSNGLETIWNWLDLPLLHFSRLKWSRFATQ